MDLNLQTEKEQEGIRKRPMLSGGLILFGVALFFSTVCTPVGVWARSDISVAESAFSPVWDIFQIVVLYAFYWVAIAFLFILLPERGILRSLP